MERDSQARQLRSRLNNSRTTLICCAATLMVTSADLLAFALTGAQLSPHPVLSLLIMIAAAALSIIASKAKEKLENQLDRGGKTVKNNRVRLLRKANIAARASVLGSFATGTILVVDFFRFAGYDRTT